MGVRVLSKAMARQLVVPESTAMRMEGDWVSMLRVYQFRIPLFLAGDGVAETMWWHTMDQFFRLVLVGDAAVDVRCNRRESRK
jgi:hypothetical protein